MTTEEEDKLVLRAVAGDDEAFNELVQRRHVWLRAVMRRLTGDSALADDLSQEVFLLAWRKIGALRDHRTFVPWLRQIALRVWLSWVRAQRLDLTDPHVEPSVQEDTAASDRRLDLLAALAQLRAGPRACIVLSYSEGMTHQEIATATGLSLGVVKSHIARATRRLRHHLKDWSTP